MKNDPVSDSQIIAENQAFWEDHYQTKRTQSNGKPSRTLVRFAEQLPPGRALDLGCSHGDDALWLAKRGWHVVAVDISAIALGRASAQAFAAGLQDRIDFQCRDLLTSFPDGKFNLVTSFFLQSPLPIPREIILRRAADAVAPEGMLLLVDHGSMPASVHLDHPTPTFPKLEETLGTINPDPGTWEKVYLGCPEREAMLPNGQRAKIKDNIIVLRRKG